MKDLLQEYKGSLSLTREEIRGLESEKSFKHIDPAAYAEMLKAAEEDLCFAIAWIQKGYNAKSHYRGVEKRDAYRVKSDYIDPDKRYDSTSVMDPDLMEFYLSDERAQLPFENIVNEDNRTIEEKELDSVMDFRESLTDELAEQLEQVKSVLLQREIDLLLLLQQGKSQEDIAEMMGVSQQAISKRIQSVKKKLSKIGIERTDL